MPKSRVNPDLDDELRQEPEFKARLREGAEAVKENASIFARQAHAPWMRRQAETIVVSESGDEIAVVNTDYGGHLLEFGSIRNPAHAPLRRGVRAAGLHFEENNS